MLCCVVYYCVACVVMWLCVINIKLVKHPPPHTHTHIHTPQPTSATYSLILPSRSPTTRFHRKPQGLPFSPLPSHALAACGGPYVSRDFSQLFLLFFPQVVIEQGGLAPGGLNFDCKIRRESTDLEDMFIAHVGTLSRLTSCSTSFSLSLQQFHGTSSHKHRTSKLTFQM